MKRRLLFAANRYFRYWVKLGGRKRWRLLVWDYAVVVARSVKCEGGPFRVERGSTSSPDTASQLQKRFTTCTHNSKCLFRILM